MEWIERAAQDGLSKHYCNIVVCEEDNAVLSG